MTENRAVTLDPDSPTLFWLNLESKAEVNELFAEWKAAGAKIVS
jgi:hypothetical protein